jgi:hypothetical protein
VALLCALPSTSQALDIKKRYEEQLIKWAMKLRGLEREANPQGKRVVKIVVVRETVIAQSDPWPNFFNWVHIKTRDYIVRQELLFRVGQRYKPKRVRESERNLRALGIFAVARVVACKGKSPDEIVILAVTKDLWSLRFNFVYDQVGGVWRDVSTTPTENNFLGRGKALGLHFRLTQLDFAGPTLRNFFAFGARYFDRRILGSRLRFFSHLDLFFDGKVPCGGFVGQNQPAPRQGMWCPTSKAGQLRGVFGRLYFDRPLMPLSTRWSFELDLWIDIRQRRGYLQDGSLATVENSDVEEENRPHVPLVYDGEVLVGELLFRRTVGTELKHDFSWGLLFRRVDYAPPRGFPFDEQTRDWFVSSVLPRSETTSTFFLRYDIRPTRFLRLRNVESLALTEDFSLGPKLRIEAHFGKNLEEFGQSFVELIAEFSYRLAIGEHLVFFESEGSLRYQRGLRNGIGPWVNKVLAVRLHYTLPPLWIGRFLTHSSLTLREDDLNRRATFFGPDVVRGYPSLNLRGRNAWRFNVEYRTRALNIYTVHLAAALFYDGGSVFGAWAPGSPNVPFEYLHSIGMGLRFLFPQFDRDTFRIDIGIPLNPDGRGAVGTWVSATFGPAFSAKIGSNSFL